MIYKSSERMQYWRLSLFMLFKVLHSSFMRMTETNEAGLIERILGVEKELFHELLRRYERMVYLTLFSIVRNEADAEDGAQEAVINAYRHLTSFRGDAKFSTWLTTIAI